MSDEEKLPEESVQTPKIPEEAPAPAPEVKPMLNDQKKNALLRYMAILFGVAFLLVALSFLIQMRDSHQEISQLSQSNASALQNAEKLQTNNRDLTAENERLNQALTEATQQLTQTQAELVEAQLAVTDAETAAQNVTEGTEFLALAVTAWQAENFEQCRGLLLEAEVYYNSLRANARALYDQLKILTAETPS